MATPFGRSCALDDIECLQEWQDGMNNTNKVPSRIAYSVGPDGKSEVNEWGDAIKSDQLKMVHTKLELDPGTVLDELESILDILDGMDDLAFETIMSLELDGNPPYTHKTPEAIVTDYLTNVVRSAEANLKVLNPDDRENIPTDIVITVPTVCATGTGVLLFNVLKIITELVGESDERNI